VIARLFLFLAALYTAFAGIATSAAQTDKVAVVGVLVACNSYFRSII